MADAEQLRAQLLDALADQRDRLADELFGLEVAQDAACSPAALAALLVPGIGVIIAQTARAACFAFDAAELEQRLQVLRGLIETVEGLAADVAAAPAERLPEMTDNVVNVIAALDDVSVVNDLAGEAMRLAQDLAASARAAAGAGAGFFSFLFSPLGLAAAGVGALALLRR